jgi:hypothetical protein
MTDPMTWEQYRDTLCQPIENELFGFSVQNKDRLIRAIISNARSEVEVTFPLMKQYKMDSSLETKGDCILDFAIFDHFAHDENYTAQQLDDFRQHYGKNRTLQIFSREILKLYKYIL